MSERAENIWIDSAGGFIAGAWYWPQEGLACSTVVVVVPGIAHEERTMSGGLVALAEALCERGLPTLLIELHGCSQSAGRLDDDHIGELWRADIRAAVEHARSTGAARVIVVSARLSVPLAADALAHVPLAALVAWAPIVSGKRYLRVLKLLQRSTEPDPTGAIAIGGFSIPPSVIECISGLDLGTIEPLSASCVMLRDMTEGLSAPWLSRLADFGLITQEQVSTQIHPWLFGGGDQPDLPLEDIGGLARWCRALHDQQASARDEPPLRPARRPAIEFVHDQCLVRETFVEIGPDRLTGILCEPVGEASGRARMLLSTVGPGRTFAEFARDDASRGKISLRFDFAGFGTSGRGDALQGGELYSDQGCRDVQAAVDFLRQHGHQHIYGIGFCAGAWSMMQAAAPEIRAMVAINVALYRQPGPAMRFASSPSGARLTRLSSRFARNSIVRRLARRMLRRATKRREPVEWLVHLCNSNVRVLLAYADPDPGLHYLNAQMAQLLGKQLRRAFTLKTYPGLGHLAEGPSARNSVFSDVAEFLVELDSDRRSARERRADARSTAEPDSNRRLVRRFDDRIEGGTLLPQLR